MWAWLPSYIMGNKKKIIIVGAGVCGLCSAYYLIQAGHDVMVIDNSKQEDNCSYGNAGLISPSHVTPLASPGIISQGVRWMLNSESPFYIKPSLNKELISWAWKFYKSSTKKHVNSAAPYLHELLTTSKDLFDQLIAELSMESVYQKTGLIIYCNTTTGFEKEKRTADLVNRVGQYAEILSRAEALKFNPGLDLDIKGAVMYGNDASIPPGLFMNSLTVHLTKMGVQFNPSETISRVSVNNRRVVSIASKTNQYVADEFVIAAGSWTANLVKSIGVNLSLQGGKGYSFTLKSPVVMPKVPSILFEARVAITSMEDGLRFAGTLEFTGLNTEIDQNRIAGIVKSVMAYFPQFKEEHFEDIKPWAGLRPCTPDGLPYIGRTKKYSNLLIATGHAMLGLSLGPVTGKLIADAVDGEVNNMLDSDFVGVDRFG